MTYANFTRPLWNWLCVPGSPAGGGLGMTLGRTTDYTGFDFYRAHREFAAAFPWRTRLHTMNALDTHDTPRFLTSAREAWCRSRSGSRCRCRVSRWCGRATSSG